MDIYKAGDEALHQLVQQQRHLNKAHRARCEEVSEIIMATIRKEFDSKFDLDKNFHWVLNRHVITFGAGPQNGRPTGVRRLPDAELVMYFSNPYAFQYLEDFCDDNQKLSLEIKMALNESSQFCHVQSVFDVGTCAHNLNVTVEGLRIFIKYAWERIPNPKKDFVATTWSQMQFQIQQFEPSRKTHSRRCRQSLIPITSKFGAARLAKYLREQPQFIKNLVLLAKLWLACNVLDDNFKRDAPEDPFLAILTELVAIRCGQTEYANCYSESYVTKAFTEMLKLMSTNISKVCVNFDDVEFPSSLLRNKYEDKRGELDTFLDPINPYMDYFWNPHARNAWQRLGTAAVSSLNKIHEYERNREKWWRCAESDEEFWTNLLFNEKASGMNETIVTKEPIALWRKILKCFILATLCVILSDRYWFMKNNSPYPLVFLLSFLIAYISE